MQIVHACLKCKVKTAWRDIAPRKELRCSEANPVAALAVLGVSRAMVLASSFGFKHYGRFLVLKQAKSKLKVQGKPLIFVGSRLAKLAQNFGLRSTSLTPAECLHVCEQQRLVEVLSHQILPPSPRDTPAPAAVCVCGLLSNMRYGAHNPLFLICQCSLLIHFINIVRKPCSAGGARSILESCTNEDAPVCL